jgi:hypothetical protein
VRPETSSPSLDAIPAHSWAAWVPLSTTWITVSTTEATVLRPLHRSAGINEAVDPSQNRTLRMGRSVTTSPVDRSLTRLR